MQFNIFSSSAVNDFNNILCSLYILVIYVTIVLYCYTIINVKFYCVVTINMILL